MRLSNVALAISSIYNTGLAAGSSLYLDFLSNNQTLDPRITFTRASNATRVNSSGLTETVANNAPRFDYDPVTLAPKGLLIEEQRTNLLTYSEQFDQWTASNVTVTANVVNSPSGALTADTMDDGTTAAVSHRVLVPVTISFASGVAYTYSLYVKNLNRNFVQLAFGSAAFGATAYANFDVATGVIGTIGASATASITNVGGGWYRCALTCMATSTASDSIFVAAITSATSVRNEVYAGSNKKLYIWGAQLEAGAFPTSYIPTTTAAATRAADVAVMTGTNFSSWYNQTEGTLFCDSTFEGTLSASTYSGVIAVSSANNTRMLFTNNPSNTTGFYVQDSGVVQADLNAGSTFTIGVPYKQAGAYKTNDFAWSRNGVAALTDTSGSVPAATALQIGGLYYNGSGQLGVQHIRRIAYYPRRLSNAELRAITS